MAMSFRLYVYSLGLLQTTIAVVVFQEMYDHGWIDHAAAESLAFALGLFLSLTVAMAVADGVSAAVMQFDPPMPWYSHIASVVLIGAFAALTVSSVPKAYAATAYRAGMVFGLLPSLHISIRAEPVARYAHDLELWLESRGESS